MQFKRAEYRLPAVTFTSYAQNFEDVMLWRALSHIERGFYVDIGAQDPIIDSISLAFHERGWRGIHVEPLPYYADLLRQQRPGDTVIQAVVGNGPAMLRFFEIPGGGISTADAGVAARHREHGHDVHEIAVPCVTLAAIFDAAAEREIHWLKIDVEGFEQPVLASWGSSAARPWIVVVESTLPLTQIESHERWESTLIGYGYSPTYFDGLNRYYISEAHPEFKTTFLVPPNIFDDFALNGTANAPFHRLIVARDQERLSEALALAEAQKASADSEIAHLTQSIASQQKGHADRERTLLGQASQASGDAERIQHTLIQRENEFGEQLRATQQQWALENAEQSRLRSEHELELQLRNTEQLSQAKQEIEVLLKGIATREREFGAQLLTIQQQAALENAEQARLHGELEREMRRQQDKISDQAKREMEGLLNAAVQRERALSQQLQDERKELRSLEQNRLRREYEHAEQLNQSRLALESIRNKDAERERELAAVLLATQQQAHRETTKQAAHHWERVLSLQSEHATREQTLNMKLEAKQLELSQSEAARKTTQLEFDELLRAEREIGKVRQETLYSLQLDLTNLRSSLSWRLTVPLRAAGSWLTRSRDQSSSANTSSENGVITPPENPLPGITARHNQQLKTDCTPQGTTDMIPDDATRTTSLTLLSAAQDLKTLLQCQDLRFVQCAYMTLFKRAPDPQGLRHYVGRLRSGERQLAILSDLYSSSEAREIGVDLPWLRRAIRRHKLTLLPVVGVLLKSVIYRESKSELAIRLRVLEQRVFLLEQLIESSRQIVEQQEPMSRPQSITRDHEPDLPGMSMVAKRIFRNLSEAVADSNGKQ
jgi:FkbM family methyltransferase